MFVRSNAAKDKEYTASVLSKSLELDEQKLLNKLNSVKASEVTVARKVEKEKIQSLVELAPEGVY